MDVFWQEQLLGIFQDITPNDRKNVMEQLLAPKNIVWDKETKSFQYCGEHLPFGEWIKNIPNTAKSLKILAVKLADSLNQFKTYDDIDKVGDYLENILQQIQSVDVKHSLEQQVWKQKLYTEFIYAAANIVRHHPSWQIPQNHRGLNVPVMKTFICEVFLKQRLLGYWFKTLRNRQLVEIPHKLINEFLRQEQRVRQLEVVRASKYLFAIAPTLEMSVNPFGINRFMLEERLYGGGKMLFNGVVVNTALLAQYDRTYQERFTKQVDCIITVQSNVSRAIIDMMTQLEIFHDDQLVPLLFSRLDTSQTNLPNAIKKRLTEYEHLLCENILRPMRYVLTKNAKNSDEYEYIYIAMRQLLGSMIAVFRDFQTQPAILFNTDADVFFGRLVAYATFLEKRRNEIFVIQSDEEWQNASNRVNLPLEFVFQTASDKIEPYRALQQSIAKQSQELEKPETLMDKLLKRREKQEEKLKETKFKARSIGYDIHKSLMNLPNQFGEHIVYLEFDSQLITDENLRSYAFPAGDNGITLLPTVLTLPENRLSFDYEAFVTQLESKTEFTLAEQEES